MKQQAGNGTLHATTVRDALLHHVEKGGQGNPRA